MLRASRESITAARRRRCWAAPGRRAAGGPAGRQPCRRCRGRGEGRWERRGHCETSCEAAVELQSNSGTACPCPCPHLRPLCSHSTASGTASSPTKERGSICSRGALRGCSQHTSEQAAGAGSWGRQANAEHTAAQQPASSPPARAGAPPAACAPGAPGGGATGGRSAAGRSPARWPTSTAASPRGGGTAGPATPSRTAHRCREQGRRADE